MPAICAAGENFCGVCGVNLAEVAAEQLERVGDDFRIAEMRSAEQFDAALALKPDHAYAKGLAEQVRTH